MKGFYEVVRENIETLSVHTRCDHTFPMHFHSNLEVLIVKSGSYKVTVNGVSAILNEGSLSVADSYDMHAYTLLERGEAIVVIVPHKYLSAYNAIKNGKAIKTPFLFDDKFCLGLYDFCLINMRESDNALYESGIANAFLGKLVSRLELKPSAKTDGASAIKSILSYVHKNYKYDIKRRDIAKTLGYTETYVSKVFNAFSGESLSGYINKLRYEYVLSELSSGTSKTLTELIYDAGFQSRQTYFRTKKLLNNA